jgi:dienelactone hydrolase
MTDVADRMAPRGLRFAGHVSFYGPCLVRFANRRTTGAPLLMLYGTDDQIIDPARCAAFADDLRIGGSNNGFVMSNQVTRELMLSMCVSEKPYPIGRDDAVRQQSNRDFGRFLARVLHLPSE